MSKKLNFVLSSPALRQSLERRFNAKVDRGKSSDCWMWKGKAKHMFGYGVITAMTGFVVTSHRIAWALENGPIPEGKHVLHTCDVPACCNPRHLYIGDNRANADDRVARGRTSKTMHTPETIEKIKRGRMLNPPKVSEAGRRSQSDAMKKRWSDPAWRERFRVLMSGEKNPRFGKKPPQHQLDAARLAIRRGFKLSDETKAKIREAALRRYRGST